MARRLRSLPLIAPLMLLVNLAAAPAVSAGDPCYHGYSIPPATSASTSVVTMEPCAFAPTIARVEPGTTLTFTNASGDAHLLTGANQAWGDRDALAPAGASVSVRFDEPGVYAFSCALHRGMSGAVVVGDAGQAAAAVTTPTPGDGGGGLLTSVVLAGLAVFAVAGWALALAQRRRAISDRQPRLA